MPVCYAGSAPRLLFMETPGRAQTQGRSARLWAPCSLCFGGGNAYASAPPCADASIMRPGSTLAPFGCRPTHPPTESCTRGRDGPGIYWYPTVSGADTGAAAKLRRGPDSTTSCLSTYLHHTLRIRRRQFRGELRHSPSPPPPPPPPPRALTADCWPLPLPSPGPHPATPFVCVARFFNSSGRAALVLCDCVP